MAILTLTHEVNKMENQITREKRTITIVEISNSLHELRVENGMFYNPSEKEVIDYTIKNKSKDY